MSWRPSCGVLSRDQEISAFVDQYCQGGRSPFPPPGLELLAHCDQKKAPRTSRGIHVSTRDSLFLRARLWTGRRTHGGLFLSRRLLVSDSGEPFVAGAVQHLARTLCSCNLAPSARINAERRVHTIRSLLSNTYMYISLSITLLRAVVHVGGCSR